MCGLVGLAARNRKEFDFDLLIKMALEAQIRGQHATGIAFLQTDGCMGHAKFPLPASDVDWSLFRNLPILAAIVHTRYSTSDLQFNQPNMIDDTEGKYQVALIHNGVVSQADPSTWETLFGVKCKTRNDSEILAQLYAEGVRHPLEVEPSSQACIVLDRRNGTVRWWRNEERPLYFSSAKNRLVIGSTKDILIRSGAEHEGSREPCYPCVEYTFNLSSNSPSTINYRTIREPKADLQYALQ
jgi:glutamine phosphoribosylpyrophosphate amidotransferase